MKVVCPSQRGTRLRQRELKLMNELWISLEMAKIAKICSGIYPLSPIIDQRPISPHR